MKRYFVYILSSQKNGTLYIGVTSNLALRIYQHKEKIIKGFTSKYNITTLVYVEEYLTMYEAISREKRLKSWPRVWKIELIEQNNKSWDDLSKTFLIDLII